MDNLLITLRARCRLRVTQLFENSIKFFVRINAESASHSNRGDFYVGGANLFLHHLLKSLKGQLLRLLQRK
jgi:hypothetical protein